ncbi:MAG: hypothetical protein M3O34_00240, partial [Chloroflexota bacterium]|nr:hypothetical protein [Chloroflexota bacterium]
MSTSAPRRLSLRLTLVSLLVGLLLATVISLATVAQLSVGGIVAEMEARSFGISALAIGAQVDAYVKPALPVLDELLEQTERGRPSIDDADAIAELLIGRLRHAPTIGWLSFSSQADGRFVGAWRRADGAIILNRSAPDVDGGRPSEVEVAADGRRTPFWRDLPGGYDPRQRPWYRLAAESNGVVWTEPFQFNEGAFGITAAVALRSPENAELLGVFTADFFLDDISRFLGVLAGGTNIDGARLLLLSRHGMVVADSAGRPDGLASAMADAAKATLPGGFDRLEPDRAVTTHFGAGGTRYIGGFQAIGTAGGPEWVAAVVTPEDVALDVVYDQRRTAVLLGLLFLAVAVALGSFVAHRIAAPLHAVARDLERVGRFELSPDPPPSSFVAEIAVVGESVNRMKAGLRSFGRYVPTEIVGDLLARGEEARLGGEYRSLTVFFSDVEGFTRIGEHLEPSQLVEHLGEYLEAMTAILRDEAGTIDKFLGDGILAFFNAPRDVPDHITRACRAALHSQARLRQLGERWESRGAPVIRARIGLHVGEVLVGNIGTPERFEYTVIGDAVNLASRFESLNKLYGTRILASEDVRAATGSAFEWRRLDRVAVAGREDSTLVVELLGESGDL